MWWLLPGGGAAAAAIVQRTRAARPSVNQQSWRSENAPPSPRFLAFGLEAPTTVAAAFGRDEGTGFHAYVARCDGELACGMIVRHHQGNAYTWGLAATPVAHGTLIAFRLLRAAIT